MPITYDIQTDYLYQEGIQKGLQKGRQEGIMEERTRTARQKISAALKLLQTGVLSVQQVAEILNLSVKQVQDIKKELGE